MEQTLDTFASSAVPPGNKPIDPRGDPRFYDYTWTNWLDIVDPKSREEILREEANVTAEHLVYDGQIQEAVMAQKWALDRDFEFDAAAKVEIVVME